MDDRKCRITGRVEEWMKSICQNHKCKYYIHQDYPSCSYCTHPTNCDCIPSAVHDPKNEVSN